jgi:hypothetical protein
MISDKRKEEKIWSSAAPASQNPEKNPPPKRTMPNTPIP